MKVSMIAAMADDRIIGLDNKMPWHLPADLQFFKGVTLGKPVIMGRKTYQSIGRPLPGRQNIVLTRNQDLNIEGVDCVQTLEQATQLAGDVDEVMIIGGATIYEQYLDKADRLYLTFIDLQTKGDTRFPDFNASGQWQQVEQQSHLKDDKNLHNYQFVTLDRIKA